MKQTVGTVRTALLTLFAAVTLVLLIAAANVANLLFMRGTQRQHEYIAIRTALGASRGRIVSQLLVESVPLSILGGALGGVLAYVGLHAISASLPSLDLPRASHVGLNAHVLVFSLLLCFATTLIFGLTPAITSSRTNRMMRSSKAANGLWGREAEGRGGCSWSSRWRCRSVPLVGAGLLVQSFLRLTSVDRGFRIDRILTLECFFAGQVLSGFPPGAVP